VKKGSNAISGYFIGGLHYVSVSNRSITAA
jgi:hypothetical protein